MQLNDTTRKAPSSCSFTFWSLMTQFLVIFSVVIFVAGGVTLAICLGMVDGLGKTASSSADHVILKNTRDNAADLGNEIASMIDLQLQEIAHSICKSSSAYASTLLGAGEENVVNGTLWKPADSYKEFNFVKNCQEPLCPPDYGNIFTRSRIPYLAAYQNGSIAHSSVFLFNKRLGTAIRNISAWNYELYQTPAIATVVNSLAFQDSDFRVLYNSGPTTTVMFYLSVGIKPFGSSSLSHVVHRTYPGIEKNQTNYDPSSRTWYDKAPVDGINVFGPYVESFTKQIVITLSSKKSKTLKSGANVDIIAGAVLLIQDVASIMRQIEYPQGGFAALITYQTNNVVVWRDDRAVYNKISGKFLTVQDIDPALASHDLSSDQVFNYRDINGTHWIVTSRSLFVSDTTSKPSFIVLVFANKYLAEEPLRSLDSHVSETTAHVTTTSLIVVLITVGVVLALVLFLVWFITNPIEKIRRIASNVVKMTAEDDDHKDYQPMINEAYQLLTRGDEIGIMCSDFYNIVCMLDNKLQQKRNTPTFPANPLNPFFEANYTATATASVVSTDFIRPVFSAYLQVHQLQNSTTSVNNADENNNEDLDILASMMRPTAGAGEKIPPPTKKPPTTRHGPENPAYTLLSNNHYHTATVCTTDDDMVVMKTIGSDSAFSAPPIASEDIEMLPLPLATRTDILDSRSHVSSSTSHAILQAKPLGLFASLRSQLYAINFLLITGMVVAMTVTVFLVNKEGDSWTTESSENLQVYQLQNLKALSNVKKRFVQTYFELIALDLRVGATVFRDLLNGDLNRAQYIDKGLYLPSYSIDSFNTYFGGPTTSFDYSGYFIPSDANCLGSGNCAGTQQADYTRLTSLFDVKFPSYFYVGNSMSFLQTALASNGFTRYMPYNANSQNAAPTSCLISPDSLTDSYCYQRYMNSKCGDASQASYPTYDARCRSWYTEAAATVNNISSPSLKTVFQYPRVSSSGRFVLTASIPIVLGTSSSSVAAVISSNVLATDLSASINELTVLKSGYCYIVDALNATNLILHPKASSTCTHIQCAETFDNEAEYVAFVSGTLRTLEARANSILHPQTDAAAIPTQLQNTVLLSTYRKGGQTWRAVVTFISLSEITASPTTYALIMTVPQREVDEAGQDTKDVIQSTVTNMIIVFVIAIVVYIVVLLLVTRRIIRAVVSPIDDIRAVFNRIVHGSSTSIDNNHNASDDNDQYALPEHASSLDMRTLLDAMAQLLVALRFGVDMFARGRNDKAEKVFRDALTVFRTTDNLRGIGASLNNLAGVCLAQGRLDEAEKLYLEAISVGEMLLAETTKVSSFIAASGSATSNNFDGSSPQRGDPNLERLWRILSDRRGNLANVYLEKGDFGSSFVMLESLLKEDRDRGYVRGCVVKQGTLGQYYLKQGEIKSADRIFNSAFAYIQQLLRQLHIQEQTPSSGVVWDVEEVYAAQQIAMYNLVLLELARTQQERKDNATAATAKAMQLLIEALCVPPVWHIATTKKLFSALDEYIAEIITMHTTSSSTNSSATATDDTTTVDIIISGELLETRRMVQEVAKHLHESLFGEAGSLISSLSSTGGSSPGGRSGKKQVFVAVDYSGSMSGTKIRSARENLLKLIEEHVANTDSIMLVSFNQNIVPLVALQQKDAKLSKPTRNNNSSDWKNLIDSQLATPSGSTALYDAIDFLRLQCEKAARTSPSEAQWLVVLTDGEDTSSKCHLPDCLQSLRAIERDNFGLIVVGIGHDLSVDILQSIVDSRKALSKLILAEGNQKGIEEAFGTIARIIKGDILLEAY